MDGAFIAERELLSKAVWQKDAGREAVYMATVPTTHDKYPAQRPSWRKRFIGGAERSIAKEGRSGRSLERVRARQVAGNAPPLLTRARGSCARRRAPSR